MRGFLRRPTPEVEVGVLKGTARVLDMADRMRRSGGETDMHRLHREAEEAFQRGEIEFDEVTVLFKHAAIHSGAINPCRLDRFRVCPVCEAYLDADDQG